jgi:hypothetical protein
MGYMTHITMVEKWAYLIRADALRRPLQQSKK